MKDDNLFEDNSTIQIITPYRKLRKLRGWSLEEAAFQFGTSTHTLLNIELGRRDCPKWLIRKMDSTYGCNGRLISYWLPRFSWGEPPPPTWWERVKAWFRRWIYGKDAKA